MMATPEPDIFSWDTLLRSARAGDRDALGTLLDLCRPQLQQTAIRDFPVTLQPKADASDLVQDSLLEAQRHFTDFRGQSQPELQAWLLTIVHHRAANVRRHFFGTDKRDPRRELSIEAAAAAGVDFPAHSTSPSGKAAQREQDEALRRAIAGLSEDYRQVIALRHQQNLSFEQIGDRLGCATATARKLWVRAIEALRDELKESS
jgi:RNA polymerase sigma-70 factor, ECF subfamily